MIADARIPDESVIADERTSSDDAGAANCCVREDADTFAEDDRPLDHCRRVDLRAGVNPGLTNFCKQEIFERQQVPRELHSRPHSFVDHRSVLIDGEETGKGPFIAIVFLGVGGLQGGEKE